jgi:SAM-dependent methyltransferase
MHDTAYEIGREFFNIYVKDSARILDVGAKNVNGTLRDFAPINSEYIGIDIEPGPGVDIVLTDPYKFPFKGGHFDVVVSSSCFEHDQMFWLTFLEMIRVTKPRGFIYVNAPSNGNYHRHPVDNWRFYPDAALALKRWARYEGKTVKLIECFTARRKSDIWNDCVMIFAKNKYRQNGDHPRLIDKFPESFNVRCLKSPTVENMSELTEDQILLRQAVEAVEAQKAEIASIAAERCQTAAALALTREELTASKASLAEIGQAKAAAAERETVLRAELEQRAATEVALRAEIEQRTATEAALRAEIEQRAATEAALRAEIQQRAATEATLHTEIEQRVATEVSLRVDLERHTGTEAALRTEIEQAIETEASLRFILQQAELEINARETQVTALRQALTISECRAKEHLGRLKALQVEVENWRRKLAEAERRRGEQEAACGALRAEITSLTSQLTAARGVSGAAFAALKSDSTSADRSADRALLSAKSRWPLRPHARFPSLSWKSHPTSTA